MDSNRKFQAFIAICVIAVLAGAYALRFRGSRDSTDRMTCHVNLRRLEGVLSLIITEGGQSPVGEITGDVQRQFRRQLQVDSYPECPAGGSYSVTVSERIICSVHGTDDNLITTDKDFERPESRRAVDAVEKAVITEIVEIYAPPAEKRDIPELEQLLTRARRHMYARNMEEAIPLLLQAFRLDESRLDILFLLASAYESEAMYSEARDIYGRILEREPANEHARQAINQMRNQEYFELRLSNRYERGWSVVFVSWTGDVGRDTVYMMNVNGSSSRPVLTGLRRAIYQLHPDENRIFVAENAMIYEVDFTGQNRREVYNNNSYPISAFALSRDGEHIAFTSHRNSRYQKLYLLEAGSDEALKVTTGSGNCAEIGWSHHGREVIFTQYKGNERSDIYVSRLDGRGGAVPLTRDGMGNCHPDWSHNRSFVVYASRTGGESDISDETTVIPTNRSIWSMSGMGSNRREIVGDRDIDMKWPRLSPTGGQVAFFGTKNGVTELYVVSSDGGRPRQITSFNRAVGSSWNFGSRIEWFPDETLLYFSAGPANRRNLHLLEVSSGRHIVVYDSQTNDDWATIVHPGRRRQEIIQIRPVN